MRTSELVCACALLLVSILVSGCYSDDYYGQQQGGYGYEQQGEYGQQQGGEYGQQGYPQQQGYPDQGYPQQQQGAADPYANQGYPEAGDVVTLPGDGASGYDTNYGNQGYDNSGYVAPSTAGSGGTYTVKKGDNLYRIGKAHGASMQDIMQANGLTTTTIYPGQELRIP